MNNSKLRICVFFSPEAPAKKQSCRKRAGIIIGNKWTLGSSAPFHQRKTMACFLCWVNRTVAGRLRELFFLLCSASVRLSEVLLSCPELPSARRAWTEAYASPLKGSGGGWELERAVDEKPRELGLCSLCVRS